MYPSPATAAFQLHTGRDPPLLGDLTMMMLICFKPAWLALNISLSIYVFWWTWNKLTSLMDMQCDCCSAKVSVQLLHCNDCSAIVSVPLLPWKSQVDPTAAGSVMAHHNIKSSGRSSKIWQLIIFASIHFCLKENMFLPNQTEPNKPCSSQLVPAANFEGVERWGAREEQGRPSPWPSVPRTPPLSPPSD